jgi:heptosyltransferase-1
MPTPLHDLSPRRVALIKPSALGDLVHTLPVLTALRQRFPDAHLAWVVNDAYEPLLSGHPHLDSTIPFPRGSGRAGVLSLVSQVGAFVRRLRRESFDLVVDLQGLLRSGLLTRASGAPRRVGLDTSREGARYCYTDVVAVPKDRPIHAVDRLWRAAEALGAGDQPKQFVLPIDPAAAEWAEQQLQSLPRPWLMVAAGSRWQTKRWPAEHFATLARRSQSVFGGAVVFVGSREDSSLADSVRARLTGPSLNLAGRTTLPQLVAMLDRADSLLGNDTGPLHVACALGRPVVAPYTCTQAALTGPFGQESRVVETKVWCAGSLRKRCSRLECMAELTPARLWPVLQEVLLSWHVHSRCA